MESGTSVTRMGTGATIVRAASDGGVDDVVVVALAFRYAARQVPRSVLLDAWPGKASTTERVLGPVREDRKRPRRDLGDVDHARP